MFEVDFVDSVHAVFVNGREDADKASLRRHSRILLSYSVRLKNLH